MFSSKKQPAIRSLIGEGTVLHGEVRFEDGLRIDGEVHGDVTAVGDPQQLLVQRLKARPEVAPLGKAQQLGRAFLELGPVGRAGVRAVALHGLHRADLHAGDFTDVGVGDQHALEFLGSRVFPSLARRSPPGRLSPQLRNRLPPGPRRRRPWRRRCR